MNPHATRNILVAVGMAAVLGTIAITFALSPSAPGPIAQVPDVPAPVAQVPEAPASVGQIPDIASPVAQPTDTSAAVVPRPGTPAAVTHADSARATAGKSAKADTRVAAATPTASAVDTTRNSAAGIPASGADRATSVEEPSMPPATIRMSADVQQVATGTDFAATDSRISSDVKSRLAADTMAKDVDVGVTTTNGAVVLTGTLATQDAIEHVKNVAEKVRDVKSVDASALKITST